MGGNISIVTYLCEKMQNSIPAIMHPHDFEVQSFWRCMPVKLNCMNLCRENTRRICVCLSRKV